MTFSFRNIFNPEDGDSEGAAAPAGGDTRHQAPFSPEEGAGKPIRSQVFQVSELLPFIPPAIAAEAGIPMTKEVDIPLSPDGSNDVLLSTIYQVCPELFAAEITPLNESTVTLPAKLGNIPNPASQAKSPLVSGNGFLKPPGMAASAAAPASKASPAAPVSEKSNPFWSPDDGDEAPGTPQQPPSNMSESHSQPRAASSSSESKPPQGLGGIETSQEKSPSPPSFNPATGRADGPAPQAPDPVQNGFSAPSPAGANPFEQMAAPGKESPKEAVSSPGSQFSGNPFESEGGYSTLFPTQAEEDSEIPFPSPASNSPKGAAPQPEKATEVTWGTMFDAKAEPESESEDGSNGFESIGNLIPKSVGAAPKPAGGSAFGSPADHSDNEDDYGLFLPPLDEEHELPAAFQVDSPSADIFESDEAEPSVKEEASPPSFGFEPAAPPAPQGFSEVKEEPAAQAPTPQPEAVESKPETLVLPDAAATLTPSPSVNATGSAFSGSPAASLKPLQPLPSTVSVEPETAPAPVVKQERATEAPAAPAPAAIPGLSLSGEIRDLELRAIFSTSDSFTLRSVARRVVALPGIASCALATPGRLVQASRNEESRIGDEAKEMVQTIRNLAKLTGLPDAQSFTLHTDKGIVSLFLDGECCLTVHHESLEFEPGTREKLILISRNLEKLEK